MEIEQLLQLEANLCALTKISPFKCKAQYLMCSQTILKQINKV